MYSTCGSNKVSCNSSIVIENITVVIIVSHLKTFCLIQVEVCTVCACLKSDAVIGTTAEAVAQDLSPPVPSALSTDSVRVAWKEPGASNGIILRYDLMRKARLPCGQEYVISYCNTYRYINTEKKFCEYSQT